MKVLAQVGYFLRLDDYRAGYRGSKKGRSVYLFTGLPRETVRKVSEMSGAWPYGPPKRDFSAHCVVRIPAKLTAGALLRSLLGQFLSEGE